MTTSSLVVGIVPSNATEVLMIAAAVARRFDAELACASVNAARYTAAYTPDGDAVSLPRVPGRGDGTVEQFDPQLKATIETTLRDSGVPWSTYALAGDPGRELELLADRLDAHLIVVGTRDPGARETLRELFAGSVADQLSHRQRRPVLVVPLDPVQPS